MLLGAAMVAAPLTARAQDDVDPAITSRRPALRVLLGRGEAVSGPAQTFQFDGAPYRGTFQRLDDGQIVNFVDLEAYLYSVVPLEMPPSWPPAALRRRRSARARTFCNVAIRGARTTSCHRK